MTIDALVEQLPEAVGRRVRDSRSDRGWTLDQLAQLSGVSRRMIINVEAGSSNASIATLLRLATALHVSLADLVTGPSPHKSVVVSPAADRTPLWRGPAGGSAVMVAAADTTDMLELWDWKLEPGEAFTSDPHRAGTRELLHILSGNLTLALGSDVHELHTGDGVSVVADVAHEYRNESRRSVRFTMAVLEPMTRLRP